MNHASRTKRFALPSCLGLVTVLVLAGCQSGGQSDLITRELRMQEDQIYAMEDYLAQYQQLLCQVRAENAALKRQLAVAEDGDELPVPTRGPSIRAPGRAPAKEEQQAMPPDTEIIEPDVPPLQETTSDDPHLEVRGQSPDTLVGEPVKFVQIRGEVVANESGGGPRLAVDVEPLSAALEPARFAGAVSLMLLEPSDDGPPHSLARWDYSAAEARAMLDGMPPHQTIRFRLELPPDTPTTGTTEFWVRLMPEAGGKVLGHVRVDLSRPGEFASMMAGAPPRDDWHDRQRGGRLAPIGDRSDDVSASAFDRGDNEGWTIARPDRPGPFGANGGKSSAEWRAATGPMPVIVEGTAPKVPTVTQPAVQQAAFVEAVKTPQAPPAPVIRAENPGVPVWTPERSVKTSADAKTRSEGPQAAAGPARPAWSPLR